MLSRFSTVLQNAVDALAPPVSLLHDFTYHWMMVMKFYLKRGPPSKVTIENTNIPGHLDQLLKILLEEEGCAEYGATGSCLEYFLQHHLLDLLATLACTDCPPGMKQFTLIFVRKLITQMKQPILPHVAIYVPIQRMVSLCNGKGASPTEAHEIAFLCSLCAVICKYPQLTHIFINQGNLEDNQNCIKSSQCSGVEDVKMLLKFTDTNIESSCSSQMSNFIDTNKEIECITQCNAVESDVFHTSEIDEIKPSGSQSESYRDSPVDLVTLPLQELQLSDTSSRLIDPVGNQCQLLDALLSFLHSADSSITIKACEGIMVIASLQSDGFAHWVVQYSSLCMTLSKRLQMLYEAIPLDIEPNDFDDMQVTWGLDTPLWSDGTLSPGCRQVAVFLAWLDYCDQLVREAHPIIGSSIAQTIRVYFFEEVWSPPLLHTEINKLLTTAFISKCLKQTSSTALLTELIHWLIGSNREPELLGVVTCPIKQQLLDNCFHELDEVSLETLRLFEVLLEKNSEHVFHCLIFTYLNTRSYYKDTATNSLMYSWSDEEDEREKLRSSTLVDFSPSSSPVSRTLAPSNIHKIINSFLFLLPQQLHSATEPKESGYEHYVQDADRQYQTCITQCSHYMWPTEATFQETNDYDDSSSSDSRPEADHKRQFYEGPFLRMIFTRMLRLPYQPYAINLQLTGLVSRLAMLPHPYLHEFLLNPLLPVLPEVDTLFNVIQVVANEMATQMPLIPDYKQLLFSTRQKLLGDSSNIQEESNSLLASLIVLEEFCKELAAIAFVKYHHST